MILLFDFGVRLFDVHGQIVSDRIRHLFLEVSRGEKTRAVEREGMVDVVEKLLPQFPVRLCSIQFINQVGDDDPVDIGQTRH